MKLYRSVRDKKLFGVCGGIAESFGVDPTLVRLIVVATAIFSGGTMVLLYLVAAVVMPKEPVWPYGSPPYGAPYGSPYGSAYGSQPGYGYRPHDGGWPPAGPGAGVGGTGGMYGTGTGGGAASDPVSSPIDEAMKDLEKKALLKEIERLKAKLAQYEKQEKGE